MALFFIIIIFFPFFSEFLTPPPLQSNTRLIWQTTEPSKIPMTLMLSFLFCFVFSAKPVCQQMKYCSTAEDSVSNHCSSFLYHLKTNVVNLSLPKKMVTHVKRTVLLFSSIDTPWGQLTTPNLLPDSQDQVASLFVHSFFIRGYIHEFWWESLCKLSPLRNRKFDLISLSGWNTMTGA